MRIESCLKLTAVVLLLALASGCRREVPVDEQEAIGIAIGVVEYRARRDDRHVAISKASLRVDSVDTVDDGWTISLAEGRCRYLVYVDRSGGVDVSGVSGDCWRQRTQPDPAERSPSAREPS